MKKFNLVKAFQILLIFIFFSSISYAQTYGITLQGGVESRKLLKEEFQFSNFDSTLKVNLVSGYETHYYAGFNLYKENGTNWDFLTSFDFYNIPVFYDLSQLDPTQSPDSLNFQEVANWKAFRIALYVDRFKPFAKRNDKVSILWGYGISPYYFNSDIIDSKVSNLYRREDHIGGVTGRLLGKVLYKSKNPRFLLDGVIGVNLFDFGFEYVRNYDPMLTMKQQTNSIFDFRTPVSPLIKFGITYLLNPIKKSKSNE